MTTPFVPDWNDGSVWNQLGAVWGPATKTNIGGYMQNLVSFILDAQKQTALDTKRGALEQEFDFLLDLTSDQRKGLTTMGDKSEAFCRQTVLVLGQNTGSLPASFNLAELQGDLANLDKVRPLLSRMMQLMEKLSDTELALCSDIMAGSLEGYGILKVTGKGAGLDGLRQQMSARFTHPRKKKDTGTTTTGTTPNA